jgi:hypothetical protein
MWNAIGLILTMAAVYALINWHVIAAIGFAGAAFVVAAHIGRRA